MLDCPMAVQGIINYLWGKIVTLKKFKICIQLKSLSQCVKT
jgi:hypothetical protein